MSPYKLASRSFRPGWIGHPHRRCRDWRRQVVAMAGPCSVESEDQIERPPRASNAGAKVIRGGAYKPRSRLTAFRGWGRGLSCSAPRRTANGLLVVSEVMDQTQIPLMVPYIDMFQVGARNMQNFNLLKELSKIRKPVLLKRGIAATIEELLFSAEYISRRQLRRDSVRARDSNI